MSDQCVHKMLPKSFLFTGVHSSMYVHVHVCVTVHALANRRFDLPQSR